MKKIMLIMTIILVIIGIIFFILWAFGWGQYITSFQVLLMFFLSLGMFTAYLIYHFLFENRKQETGSASLSNIKRIIELWKELGGETLTYTDGRCKTKTFITSKGEERVFSGIILEKHDGMLIQVVFDWKKQDIVDWDDNPSIDKIKDPLFEYTPFEDITRKPEKKSDRVELVRPKDDDEDKGLTDEGKFRRDD